MVEGIMAGGRRDNGQRPKGEGPTETVGLERRGPRWWGWWCGRAVVRAVVGGRWCRLESEGEFPLRFQSNGNCGRIGAAEQ